jgi:DNA-binding LacI/PurR family transcriptional regulator
MALGVLRAFAERGRHVPADISVVGFDDVPEAAFFLPPLTTVRQDFGELGRRAVHLLLERMSGAEPAWPALPVTPDLVVRASTAPRSAAADRALSASAVSGAEGARPADLNRNGR